MSSLYWIKEEEQYLDSLFAKSISTIAPTAAQSDPAMGAGSPQLEESTVITEGAAANTSETGLDTTILAAQTSPNDCWI